jgi:hypothetical protein
MSVRCNRDREGIAVLSIERPERRNALNLEVKGRLADEVETLAADDTVRVIVLTGSGGYFVAGTDLAEMVDMTPDDHTRLKTERVFHALRQCPKPVIAAVEGRPRRRMSRLLRPHRRRRIGALGAAGTESHHARRRGTQKLPRSWGLVAR